MNIEEWVGEFEGVELNGYAKKSLCFIIIAREVCTRVMAVEREYL